MSDSVCGSAEKAEILTENANEKMKAKTRMITPLRVNLKKNQAQLSPLIRGVLYFPIVVIQRVADVTAPFVKFA